MPQEPDPSVQELTEDPETRLSYLVDAGVFEVDGEAVTTTVAFEDTRSIYADSYGEQTLPESELVETVVELFDVDEETARARLDAGEVTRRDVVTYLSLGSFLERDLPQEPLALLTDMAAQVGVGSPVPDDMQELTDETFRDFLAAAGEAIVFVWKYPCDPCLQMKGEVPRLLAQLPDDIAIAGVDGEAVTDFRRAFEVESAPEVLLFADGELVTHHRGYTDPATLTESLGEVYDGVAVDVVDGV